MDLSSKDIDAIRSSFSVLKNDSQRAGDLFYEHLFEVAPEVRSLFPENLSEQSAKLMSVLAAVVSMLRDWDNLEPVVRELAIRHLDYGVRPAHYDAVASALNAMMADMLGDAYSDAVREGWARAYGGLSEAMIACAYPEDGTSTIERMTPEIAVA